MNTLNRDPDVFRQQDLQKLLDHHNSPCVSVYLPSQPKSADIRPVAFQLGQLLDQAEKKLAEAGWRPPEIKQLLGPGRQLQTGFRTPFWQYQSEGIALFLSTDADFIYRLPLPFDPQVYVGERFHIRPLIPHLSGDGDFYLLALSENQVRLFKGTRATFEQVDLRNAPQSVADTLRYTEFEKQMQKHSTASGVPGRSGRAAMFHSHGSVGDAASTKPYLVEFLHAVDAALMDILGKHTAPVVLAGVKGIQGAYRRVSHCQHLLDQGISGNPDRLNMQNLYSRGWALVAPHFQKAKTEALERFHRLHNKGDQQALDSAQQILVAARNQQVETLFLSAEAQVWGHFDSIDGELMMHEIAQPDDEDLLNLAAHYALSSGGTVYALDTDEMPRGLPEAAILRY